LTVPSMDWYDEGIPEGCGCIVPFGGIGFILLLIEHSLRYYLLELLCL
jgi:hypothetical protein